MENEVEILAENWIISNGTIDEFIAKFQYWKEVFTKKGYKEIYLMSPKDLGNEHYTLTDGRPKDIPMHTSFYVVGKK